MSSEKLLKIIAYPDPFLDQSCRTITAEELKAGEADGWNLAELIERMRATMYAYEGIGLAAPQVHIGLRLFVIDITKDHSGFFAIFNPTISNTRATVLEEEGCLSIPQVRAKVKRFAGVTVNGVDLKGQTGSFEAAELLARVCQHEYDHLNGTLFINKLGMTAKLLIRRQLVELEENYYISPRDF
ncbi:MAG: peptide deformylase [Planctomycetota bacterium]